MSEQVDFLSLIIHVNISLIFCSLSFAKPTVCSCKHNNCNLTNILFQRRKDAIESFENACTSTSADQPKPKRGRKSKKLPPSSVPLSTQEEEVVEAMDVSCAVEASEGVSSCPPVSDFAEECASCRAFMNEKRVLNNTVLELRAKLNDKREKLKRLEKKLKGRSCSMVTYINKDTRLC